MKIDKEIGHYFKLWQQAEQVYQNINIDEIEFEMVNLSDEQYFELGPKKSEVSQELKEQNIKVSFVPLEKIDHLTGVMDASDTRNIKEVLTGYTYFKDGDVIFTKVTPSMENGNTAIAENMVNGIGFGSSEYYVFRCKGVLNKLLYFYLRTKALRDLAKPTMTGSGGLKRVPKEFFKTVGILVPKEKSHEVQQCLVDFIEQYKAQFDKYRKLIAQLKSQVESFDKAFLPAIFSAEKDSFIVEYFDQWSIKKQLSIKFNDINFERCVLKECCSFPPLSRVKGKADLSIQEYESLSSQEQLKYFPLISGTMLNNQITGYLHKDRLSDNSLSPNPVLSWTRINASQFFIQNNPVVTNDDSFILAPNDPENIKFIYYSILAEMSKSQFSWTNKAGKEKVKNISIYSLSNSYFSSAIVDFIDEWHNWRDEIFRRIDQLSMSIDQAEEALIAKTFKGCEE